MYFRVPFALSGTRAAVPVPTQVDGTVNYTDGYGPDYQLDPGSDPSALDIERDKMNQLFFDLTSAVQRLQQFFPAWISSADNNGSPFSYDTGAVVKYTVDGKYYLSIVDTNTATPGTDPTKWQVFPAYFESAAHAAATYLTIAAAAATYLTTAVAAATYETLAHAAATYLTIANAAATYVPISATGTSGNLAIAPGNTTSILHSYGTLNLTVTFALVCLTGEFGYTAGDVIYSASWSNSSGQGVVARAPDANHLDIIMAAGSGGKVFNAINATTGASVNLTNANWALRVRISKY